MSHLWPSSKNCTIQLDSNWFYSDKKQLKSQEHKLSKNLPEPVPGRNNLDYNYIRRDFPVSLLQPEQIYILASALAARKWT